MNWLNIHTSTLRTPEFISSEPVERATWLCVLSYSAEQENGGRLLGAAHWTDRQWQQTCGVTRQEVRGAVKLLRIDGDDVLVAFYPDDKEKEVRARRLSGRKGGLRSGAARSMLSSKQKGSTPSSTPSTEGNEKGKEGNSAHVAELPSAGGIPPEANPENRSAATSGAESGPSEPEATGEQTDFSEAEEGEAVGGESATGLPPARSGVFPGGKDGADGGTPPSEWEDDAPPCNLAEALQFSRSIGCPDSVTTAWYLHRESVDWKRGTAVSIRKWEPDLEFWIEGEKRRNPDAFKSMKAEASKNAAGRAWRTVDPAAFAKWASQYTTPPQLEGATDRLVERFRRESAAANSAPSEGESESEKARIATIDHRPAGITPWSETERKAA